MRRRVAAGDLDARIALLERRTELVERLLVVAAVEPDAVPALGGAPAVARHQLGPVDAVGKPVAEARQRPDERPAVGHDERRAEQAPRASPRLVTDHQRVDRDRAHVAALAALDHAVHHVHRAGVVGERDRHAEQVALRHVRPASRRLRSALRALSCPRESAVVDPHEPTVEALGAEQLACALERVLTPRSRSSARRSTARPSPLPSGSVSRGGRLGIPPAISGRPPMFETSAGSPAAIASITA